MAEDTEYIEYDYDPRNLPKEYCEAIGLIVSCYVQTENQLETAIAGLLGIDIELGWAVTTHMGAPLRDSVIKSLSEIKFIDLDDIKEFDKLIEDIKLAGTIRNDVAHSLWCRDPSTNEVFRNKIVARRKVKAELIAVTLASLGKDVEFIYQAGMNMIEFLVGKGIVPELPPANRVRYDKRGAIRRNSKRTKS